MLWARTVDAADILIHCNGNGYTGDESIKKIRNTSNMSADEFPGDDHFRTPSGTRERERTFLTRTLEAFLAGFHCRRICLVRHSVSRLFVTHGSTAHDLPVQPGSQSSKDQNDTSRIVCTIRYWKPQTAY